MKIQNNTNKRLRQAYSQSFFRVFAYRMSQKMKRQEMEHREAHGHSFTWHLMHTIWERCANCCSWLLRDRGKRQNESVCILERSWRGSSFLSTTWLNMKASFLWFLSICCSRPLGLGNTHFYVRSSWALCWSLLLASDRAAEVWFLENCLLWLLWSRLTAEWLDCSHSVLNCYVVSSLELVSRSTSLAPSSFIHGHLHLLK